MLDGTMRCRWLAITSVAVLGCQASGADGPSPSRPASEPNAPIEAPVEAAPEPEPEPAPEPERSLLEPPLSDEVLLTEVTNCGVNSAQMLVDCTPGWQAMLRTPSVPTWTLCELDPSSLGTESPANDDLIRGRVTLSPAAKEWQLPGCAFEAIDTRIPVAEHGIQPLTNAVVAGVPTADLASKLDHDLETGPVRAFVGDKSGRVRLTSVYLRDLGELLAIPDRELLERDAFRSVLDAAFDEKWPGAFVSGARHFEPQVQDQDHRRGFGYSPVFPTCVRSTEDGPWPHQCAVAVPVMAGEERRYLVLAESLMRAPNSAALTRRLLIQRIVEDGLTPTPEAIAYAIKRWAER